MTRSTLDTLFGSRTRAKILRLLLTNPEKSYFVREISRKVVEHMNSVRRELTLLSAEGILLASGDGQKRFYQAANEYPLFHELKALVFKAEVMEERRLLSAIEGSGRIHLLLLTGFFVNRADTATDILIVGTVQRAKLEKMMRTFQQHIDREIRFTVLTKAEYEYRSSLTDRFLYNIMNGPVVSVIDRLHKA